MPLWVAGCQADRYASWPFIVPGPSGIVVRMTSYPNNQRFATRELRPQPSGDADIILPGGTTVRLSRDYRTRFEAKLTGSETGQ